MTNQLSVIILAGGLGTRLSATIGNTPKILAPINGKPFLDIMLQWLRSRLYPSIYDTYLSTGHLHQHITAHIKNSTMSLNTINESKPLGTLGAASFVCSHLNTTDVLILNGDTVFDCDLHDAYLQFQRQSDSPLLVVKRVLDSDRYGSYRLDPIRHHLISSASLDSQYISLGATFASRESIIAASNAAKERSISHQMMDDHFLALYPPRPYVIPKESFFIDIGIPASFAKAQKELTLYSQQL